MLGLVTKLNSNLLAGTHGHHIVNVPQNFNNLNISGHIFITSLLFFQVRRCLLSFMAIYYHSHVEQSLCS